MTSQATQMAAVGPAHTLTQPIVDPGIFASVQQQIDEDTTLREELRTILKTLDRHHRALQLTLSSAHTLPAAELPAVLAAQTPAAFSAQREAVLELARVAGKYPYYKYCSLWGREIQNAVFDILFCHWLASGQDGTVQGELLTIEQVGEKLGIPVNIKTQDIFHLTIEEYLHGLITLIEELARLAVNSVTSGDYARPVLISRFVKNLHAAFQVLNLKNDALRRRSDGIKYNVKRIEDVVYDLSLRNLLPRTVVAAAPVAGSGAAQTGAASAASGSGGVLGVQVKQEEAPVKQEEVDVKQEEVKQEEVDIKAEEMDTK